MAVPFPQEAGWSPGLTLCCVPCASVYLREADRAMRVQLGELTVAFVARPMEKNL